MWRSLRTVSHRRSWTAAACPGVPGSGPALPIVGGIRLEPRGVRYLSGLGGSLAQVEPDGLNALAEPTFESLGLAHAYPSGWVQAALELIHVQADLPWWATIVVGTVALRVLLIPLVIKSQRNMARAQNHMPEMKRLQSLIFQAPDQTAGLAASEKYRAYTNTHGVSPLASFWPMLGQGVCFTSMFFGLRGMAEAPVASMRDQGLLWFTDLTVADPLFILPVATASSLFMFIYTNAEVDSTQMGPLVRRLMLAIPILSIPFMCYFPSALNLYWLCNNGLTITQAVIIRTPTIREKLGIEKPRVFTQEERQWLEMDIMRMGLKNSRKPNHVSPISETAERKSIDLSEVAQRVPRTPKDPRSSN